MFDTSESPKSSGPRAWIASALIWLGTGLLVVGALIGGPYLAPYIASRLYPLPRVQALDPSHTPVAPAVSTSAGSSSVVLLPLFEQVEGEPTTFAPAPRPPVALPAPAGHPPTRIVISSIEVDAPVVATTWEPADIGGVSQPVWVVPDGGFAGWHEGSSPLGVSGNTVINGHNWPLDAVFRNLYKVQPGEQIVLYSEHQVFPYEVSEVLLLPEAGQPLEVRQANAQYIQPTDDERVTLVTCHPYGRLTYRLIIIARPTLRARPVVEEP